MAAMFVAKIVDSLPAVLQANTVYLVLVDGVCKQYVTNADGTAVYPMVPGDPIP